MRGEHVLPSDSDWVDYYAEIDKLNKEAWNTYREREVAKFAKLSDKEKMEILISDYIVRNRPHFIK